MVEGMSSSRLTPAELDLAGGQGSGEAPEGLPSPFITPPFSARYQASYHTEAGAWARAKAVFLKGSGLPARWRGRERHTILETGFGLGNNFLATWSAWRHDPERCEHLFFVSVEKHPLRADDLARVYGLNEQDAVPLDPEADTEADPDQPILAQALWSRWPELTPGLHLIHFEGDDTLVVNQGEPTATPRPWRVSLLLVWGDVADILPQLMVQADAFYLDGFAPERNPAMWQPEVLSRLNRLAAPDATVASWSTDEAMKEALSQAGFVLTQAPGHDSNDAPCEGRYQPRHQAETPAGGARTAPAPAHRTALVLGAGLAGAATAYALCREGWQVTLVDHAAGPARGASGNPAGLFHSIVHGEDGVHTRAHRAAALATWRLLTNPVQPAPQALHQLNGLLRLAPRESEAGAQALLDKLGWPASHLKWLSAQQASEHSKIPLHSGAWSFAQAGVVNPSMWVPTLLDAARWWAEHHGHTLDCVWGVKAEALQHDGDRWRVDGRTGQLSLGPDWRAHAHSVVLCNAHAANTLIQSLPPHQASVELPVSAVRGQTTVLSAQAMSDLHTRHGLPPPHRPAMAVAGSGYALSLPDGGLLLGATTQHHDRDPSLRDVDHRHNLMQAVHLGVLPEAWASWAQHLPDASSGHPLMGRTQWRATTPDRLPLVGALPWSPTRLALSGQRRLDQVRLLPRNRDERGGLYVVSGLGSRGITWAGLLVDLVAHWVAGAPCPIETDLRDAIDPARFLARQNKKPA
jgi:tRNA 5-methylaminomethyl-2-thiouridine biosynthesis bifunctional protein